MVRYLDYNATTPLDARVLAAMSPFLQRFYGNPSALYRLGRASRSAIETARAQVAQLVGVTSEQVIFTSGGTEANNLALRQVPLTARLAILAVEHPSVKQAAQHWQAQGGRLHTLAVDQQGILEVTALTTLPWKTGDWCALQWAHNETGVIQDIARHAAWLRAQGVIVHSDAVQAVGKLALDFEASGVHLLSLSSHKIYGPKGCGALIIERNFPLKPLLYGGGQEYGLRAGTENVAAIVGFGKAAELAAQELTQRQQQMLTLRSQLEQGLQQLPGGIIFAQQALRLPNTVFWGHPALDAETLLMQLDQQGIAIASGSACSSGIAKPNANLLAMGVSLKLANSAIRISLGQYTTPEDISDLLGALSRQLTYLQ